MSKKQSSDFFSVTCLGIGGTFAPSALIAENWPSDRSLFASQWMFATMTLDEAIELYKPGKVRCRGAPKLPLKELGADPATGKNITKDGRFGMCVTDGEINASLRLRETVDFITLERGFKLLAGQRAWTAEST